MCDTDGCVLRRLNLYFSADRIILRAKGGSKYDPIARNFHRPKKAAIVLRHLVDKTPVSDFSDEFGLQPTQIYAWQKQLTANAALALSPQLSTKQDDAKDRKIVALEAKIQ